MQLCALQITVAQDTTLVNTEQRDTVIIRTQPQIRYIDNNPVQANSIVIRKGDPMKATMLSTVFPGGGQIYNRKYWKLPVVYAGFGTLFYFIKSNSDKHQMYYKGYMDFIDDIPETNSYIKLFPKINPEDYDPVLYPNTEKKYRANDIENWLLRGVDYYKRNRDLSMILTGVWYILQILDANVDASLMNYNVSDNLELTLAPKMFNTPGMYSFTGFNIGFKITF